MHIFLLSLLLLSLARSGFGADRNEEPRLFDFLKRFHDIKDDLLFAERPIRDVGYQEVLQLLDESYKIFQLVSSRVLAKDIESLSEDMKDLWMFGKSQTLDDLIYYMEEAPQYDKYPNLRGYIAEKLRETKGSVMRRLENSIELKLNEAEDRPLNPFFYPVPEPPQLPVEAFNSSSSESEEIRDTNDWQEAHKPWFDRACELSGFKALVRGTAEAHQFMSEGKFLRSFEPKNISKVLERYLKRFGLRRRFDETWASYGKRFTGLANMMILERCKTAKKALKEEERQFSILVRIDIEPSVEDFNDHILSWMETLNMCTTIINMDLFKEHLIATQNREVLERQIFALDADPINPNSVRRNLELLNMVSDGQDERIRRMLEATQCDLHCHRSCFESIVSIRKERLPAHVLELYHENRYREQFNKCKKTTSDNFEFGLRQIRFLLKDQLDGLLHFVSILKDISWTRDPEYRQGNTDWNIFDPAAVERNFSKLVKEFLERESVPQCCSSSSKDPERDAVMLSKNLKIPCDTMKSMKMLQWNDGFDSLDLNTMLEKEIDIVIGSNICRAYLKWLAG